MSRIAVALAAAVAVTAAGTATATAAAGQESTLEATFLAIVAPEQASTIQAQFTVPAVNCTSSTGIEDATAQVGALSGSRSVRVPGLVTARADVMAGCVGTSALYQAQALGAPLAMTVSPGDKMLLTASFDPATQRRSGTVDDLTTGVTLTRSRTDMGGFAPFSDFAGIQRVHRDPIPDFGTIHWSGVLINGAPVGTAQSLFGFSLIRSIAHPRVLIRTSKLNTAGDAYTTTWVTGS